LKETEKFTIHDNWEYHKGDLGGIWEALRPAEKGTPEDAVQWEKVTLPHCFNAFDSVDPDTPYYQGPGWYRTQLTWNNPFSGGRTLLCFDGAGQNTRVYLGGRLAGTHIGGYDGWSMDITDLLENKTEGCLPLIVRCDNSRNLETIPSDLSDFNLYGGIYRPLYLSYTPPAGLRGLQIDSVLSPSYDSAEISIRGTFHMVPPECEIILEMFSPREEKINEWSISSHEGRFSVQFGLSDPELWSPCSPALYECRLTLSASGTGKVYSEKFGIREFRFEKHGPFYLNGERLLLKGTHRHEDHAGLGAAMTDELIEKEMKMIKAMGANFIRLGHYQQNQHVLNLCDSLGILVWEEIPWCRGGLGGDSYRQAGRDMLTAMISQHYNHPSVILWGLGNENDWPGDFPVFDEEEIREYMKELHTLAHTLDPERKTSIRRCDFCRDIPDVYSPSIWAGWYRGHYREYRQSTLDHIARTDHFLHVEWGADSHAMRYSEDPYLGLESLRTGIGTDEQGGDASLYGGISRVSKDGDWSENYACDLFDWTLKEQETIPELTGSAFWPFKDFSTPLRPENPIPYVNQKGVVERDLTPKEGFYVFQSYWSKDPMIHIFGTHWKIRWGHEGEEKEFRVYSNCPEAELFLDGKSLGIRKRDSRNFPAAGLRWTSPLKSGNHTLTAVGFSQGERVTDEVIFTYHSGGWGKPCKLTGTVTMKDEKTGSFRVQVLDSKNRPCLDCREMIRFSTAGSAVLQDNRGTSRGSGKIQCANGRGEITFVSDGSASMICAQITGLPPLFLPLS